MDFLNLKTNGPSDTSKMCKKLIEEKKRNKNTLKEKGISDVFTPRENRAMSRSFLARNGCHDENRNRDGQLRFREDGLTGADVGRAPT